MRSRLRHGLLVSAAIAAALLCIGCETPPLARDALYPADWPEFAEIGEKCLKLDDKYANRGRYVDESGKAADAWLTDALAAMPTPREGAALSSLHVCERVTLRIESYASPARSDETLSRLVAIPGRKPSESSGQWADCDKIQLPRGPGWPWVAGDVPTYERGIGLCLAKRFRYYNPHPAGLGFVPGLFLDVAQGADGTLIVKIWREGSTTATAWARFPKAP